MDAATWTAGLYARPAATALCLLRHRRAPTPALPCPARPAPRGRARPPAGGRGPEPRHAARHRARRLWRQTGVRHTHVPPDLDSSILCDGLRHVAMGRDGQGRAAAGARWPRKQNSSASSATRSAIRPLCSEPPPPPPCEAATPHDDPRRGAAARGAEARGGAARRAAMGRDTRRRGTLAAMARGGLRLAATAREGPRGAATGHF